MILTLKSNFEIDEILNEGNIFLIKFMSSLIIF